jgi:hypothetical protein
MFGWFYKWKEQAPPIQALIFTYGIYLLAIILSTFYVYTRLEVVRIPSPQDKDNDVGRVHDTHPKTG